MEALVRQGRLCAPADRGRRRSLAGRTRRPRGRSLRPPVAKRPRPRRDHQALRFPRAGPTCTLSASRLPSTRRPSWSSLPPSNDPRGEPARLGLPIVSLFAPTSRRVRPASLPSPIPRHLVGEGPTRTASRSAYARPSRILRPGRRHDRPTRDDFPFRAGPLARVGSRRDGHNQRHARFLLPAFPQPRDSPGRQEAAPSAMEAEARHDIVWAASATRPGSRAMSTTKPRSSTAVPGIHIRGATCV